MLAKLKTHNDLPSIRDAFDNFWENALNMHQMWDASTPRVPRVQVHESKTTATVRAELPGLEKRDIKVRFVESGLELSGTTSHENETKNGYQFSQASFYKLVPLPPVIKNKAEADYQNGVLTVRVPKAEIDKADREYLQIK